MASSNLQFYKCGTCGSEVEVLRGGGGTLVCCGKPTTLMAENTTDAAQEKHVPVVEKVDRGLKVTVGSVSHPMEDAHYIEWIEVISGDNTYHRFLHPGSPPEAVFPVEDEQVTVRAFCNLHGLWKAG